MRMPMISRRRSSLSYGAPSLPVQPEHEGPLPGDDVAPENMTPDDIENMIRKLQVCGGRVLLCVHGLTNADRC